MFPAAAQVGRGGERLARRRPLIRCALATLRTAVPFAPVSDELALTIVFEPGEDDWVIASIPEVKGVFSQGRTREEARANIIDALRLMLSPEPPTDDDDREREQLHLTIEA